MSQLDYLWVNFGGYKVSNEASSIPQENVLLTEQALTNFIQEYTNSGITALTFRDHPTKADTTQLIGTSSNGSVLICQRDYGEGNVTEIGNVRNKLTLNATERPQIDLADGTQEKVAYESDLIKYGMYYPGVKVDTKKLFALTKASSEDDIKAALQLKTASGSYTLPTEKILNDCLGKGYQLLSNWMPVSIAWNGAAWVFYLVGQTYMNEPNAVATVSIKITDGTYSVFQAAKVTKLASTMDVTAALSWNDVTE